LDNSVHVIPYLQRDELKIWYGAADFLVMPSHYDAFGAVAGEAMAAGLPVISTSMVGAEPDLIRDNTSGIVIPPGDADALEMALRRMLEDGQRRVEMGQRAREVASGYSTPVVMDEFLNALRSAMTQPLNSA
jgi:D-inositol-3-phosphate glycosyltransferase